MRGPLRIAVAMAAQGILAATVPGAANAEQASPGDAAAAVDVERAVTRILSIDGDAAYGEYLGSECVTCHRLSGAGDGIPPIVGLRVDYFVQALVEYRVGIRANEVMRLRTARLADDEIAALATYFSQREPR